MPWAETTSNLGRAHEALFDKTGDPAALEAAERHVAEAREVFAAAGASQYAAMARHALAHLRAKRP
jgi:hypothetical protein